MLNVRGCYQVPIKPCDKSFTTNFYFTSCIDNIYLSLDTCKKMCLINIAFPCNINAIDKCEKTSTLKKDLIQSKPNTMTFPPTKDNIKSITTSMTIKFIW